MLSFLHRNRLFVGILVLGLLLIFGFYFGLKYLSLPLSGGLPEDVKVFLQSSEAEDVSAGVPQNSKGTTARIPPEVAERARGSLVVLEMEDKNGKQLGFWSGFFVQRDQIATCFRAIEGAARGSIKLAGTERRSRIEGVTASNAKYGLAILKVTDLGVQPLSLGNSNTVQRDEEIYVAGNPWLLLENEDTLLEGTVTPSSISSIQEGSKDSFLKHLSTNNGISLDKVFQVSTHVYAGCSGGPVLNSKNKVIGISFSTLKGRQVLNCIIPSNYLRMLLAQVTLPKPLAEGEPPSAFTYFDWGSTKFEQERYQSAIIDFDEAIKLKPDFAEAYVTRGTAKSQLGTYKSAIVDFDEAIHLKPETVESDFHLAYIYSNRGLAKSNSGAYKSAIVDFDEALRLNPDDAQTYNNRGQAKFLLGIYKSAIDDFNEAIRLEPGSAEAWSNRGFVNHALGIYKSAIADSNEALRLDPENARAYFNRGEARRFLGNYAAAIIDYNAAVRLKPDFAEAYNSRGAVHSFLGAYLSAIDDYDAVIRLRPDDAKVYRDRGRIKLLLGAYLSAIDDYDAVIRLRPDDADAYFKRGLAKIMQNHIDDAKVDFHTALKLTEQSGDDLFQFIIEKFYQTLIVEGLYQTDEDLKHFVEQVIQPLLLIDLNDPIE